MADLNSLSSMPGALAAFEFGDDGKLVDSVISDSEIIDEQTLDLLGHLCLANMAIASMQARGWEAMSDVRGFYPIQGFTFVGLDWSAVARGRHAVVLENEGADFDAAYRALEK